MERSYETITKRDLRRLLALARKSMEDFFQRNPQYSQYRGKEVLIALCQGSAVHYLDRKNGVKDFDVWFFYSGKYDDLPYRGRRGVVDFGESKFGVHPEMKKKGFSGRSVDVLTRADESFKGKPPEIGIVDYLAYRETKTSKLLAEKAVIGLYPERLFGRTLWPRCK